MMPKTISLWPGTLVLSLAAILWAAAPESVLARGGGHTRSGGGYNHGYGGGYNHGGYGGGYRGGYYGGGGYGGYGGYGYGLGVLPFLGGYGLGSGGYGNGYGGYGNGYGGYGNGFGNGGAGYYNNSANYGNSYGGYGYGNGYGNGGTSYYNPANYGSSYGGYGNGNGNGGASYYNPANYGNSYGGNSPYFQAAVGQGAHLTVNVPANAEVYFNGTKTRQTGTARQFVTPPLEAGNYHYEIRATWMENGQRVNQTHQVTVHAGDSLNVDFSNRFAPPQP